MRIALGSKALFSLAGGLVITFTQVKGPSQLLLVLAGYALAHVVVLGIGAAVKQPREELLTQLPLATFATIIAIIALLGNNSGAAGAEKVHWLLIVWGLIAGAFGIWQVRRLSFQTRDGKDAAISAGLVLALAAVNLLIPNLDIVTTEGLFGAFLIIDGVHLALAATGPRGVQSPTAS